MGNGCSGVKRVGRKFRRGAEKTPAAHSNGGGDLPPEEEEELSALSPSSVRGYSAASSSALVLPGTSISLSPLPESLSELDSYRPLPDLEEFPDDIRHLLLGHFEGPEVRDNLRDIYLVVVTNGEEGLRFLEQLQDSALRTLQSLAHQNDASLHVHVVGHPPPPPGHTPLVAAYLRDLLEHDTVIAMVVWGEDEAPPQPPEELSAEAFDLAVGRSPSGEGREALHCAYTPLAHFYRLRSSSAHRQRALEALSAALPPPLRDLYITSAFEDALSLLEDCEEAGVAARSLLVRLLDSPSPPPRLQAWEQRLPEPNVFQQGQEEALERRLRSLLDDLFAEFSHDTASYHAQVAGKGVWSELRSELVQQRAAALRHLRRFEGRGALARAVAEGGGALLVARGSPGCGKSALLAAAAARCSALRPCAAVVLRSVGAAPEAATLERLLRSVCEQLAILYGENPAVASRSIAEHNSLFGALVGKARSERPLVLLLDGLEQVAECSGRSLLWLPPLPLPSPHVRLVLALATGSRELLELQERLPTECFLDVPDLPPELGSERDHEGTLSLLGGIPPLFLGALCALRHGLSEEEATHFLGTTDKMTVIRVKRQLEPYLTVQVRRGRKFTVPGSRWFRELCEETLGKEQLELSAWSCLRYFGGDSDEEEDADEEKPKCPWEWRRAEETPQLRLRLRRGVRGSLLQGLPLRLGLEGGDSYPLLEEVKLYKRRRPDDRELDALARLLRASAHALRRCPQQLPAQLYARADAEAIARYPQLRRLLRSLRPAVTCRGAPCVRSLEGVRAAVRGAPLLRLCWSGGGARLATASAEGEVTEWDPRSLQKLWSCEADPEAEVVDLRPLPGGEVLVVGPPDGLRVAGAGGWRSVGGGTDGGQGAHVTDGGRGVLVLSRRRDEILRVDVRSGHVAARIPLGEDRLATGLLCGGGTVGAGDALQKPLPVRVWDVRSGLLLRHFALRHHELDVRLAILDRNALYIAAKDLLSCSSSFLLGLDVRGGGVAWEAHLGASLCALALGGNGAVLLAATVEGRLCALSPKDGAERWSLRMLHLPVGRIETAGDTFLTWHPPSQDRTVALWNALSGAQLAIFTTDFDIVECSLSPDGMQIALLLVGQDKPTVLAVANPSS